MYFFSLCVCVSLSLSLSLSYIYIYIYIYILQSDLNVLWKPTSWAPHVWLIITNVVWYHIIMTTSNNEWFHRWGCSIARRRENAGDHVSWPSIYICIQKKKKKKATISTTHAIYRRCGANKDEKVELIVCESAWAWINGSDGCRQVS